MPSATRHFAPIDFKTRFPALDGLRALAVTAVFADHLGGGSHGGRVLRFLNDIRGRGWVGVDLFFVLSGFLITGILYDTRSDSQFFRRFFARRSVRIFPVFYMVAILLLLLTPVFQYEWRWMHLTFLTYMANLFANHDFTLYEILSSSHPAAQVTISHFWSLCVEEQFYLLWPIAVWSIRDRVRLLWTAVGISLLALALRCAMIAHFPPEFAERWIIRTLPFRMDSLLIGGVLALLLRGPAADLWQRSSKWIFLAASASVLLIFNFSPMYDSAWLLSIGLTLLALASAGLISCSLRSGSAAFQLFYFKPIRIFGKYSYGFYIYHLLFRSAWIQFLVFLMDKTHSVALSGVIALTLNFATTFLVSKLSYDLVEVQFLRLKRRFEYDTEIADHKHAFITK